MTAPTLDPAILPQWIGRREVAQDTLIARPARQMQATLGGLPTLAVGDPLPPLWHWLYFPSEAPTAALGHDGHPERGGFIPPVALPRRMWAGGKVRFHAPLRIGDTIERVSTIEDVTLKKGQSGPLCFVTVRHRLDQAVTEDHHIVYRDHPVPGDPQPRPAPPDLTPQVSRTITPNIALLFRYSALTFNAHRIHYDLDYCRRVEGYPGLVVHGPLIATLLMNMAADLKPIKTFTYRATAPVFHDAPFTLNAAQTDTGLTLWAATPDGRQAMLAEATAP